MVHERDSTDRRQLVSRRRSKSRGRASPCGRHHELSACYNIGHKAPVARLVGSCPSIRPPRTLACVGNVNSRFEDTLSPTGVAISVRGCSKTQRRRLRPIHRTSSSSGTHFSHRVDLDAHHVHRLNSAQPTLYRRSGGLTAFDRRLPTMVEKALSPRRDCHGWYHGHQG